MKLETTNRTALPTKTKELLIELLGGVRIDGLLYILATGHLSTVIA